MSSKFLICSCKLDVISLRECSVSFKSKLNCVFNKFLISSSVYFLFHLFLIIFCICKLEISLFFNIIDFNSFLFNFVFRPPPFFRSKASYPPSFH